MLDRFSKIIVHQSDLMDNFRVIEKKNGFHFPRTPVSIHTHLGQHELRRLAWHIQEELCETGEALDRAFGVGSHEVHKELIDVLHFIAEFMLSLGYWPSDLPPVEFKNNYEPDGISANLFQTMLDLGLMINLLKNKPWKQTHRDTDERFFKERLSKFIHSFILTCYASGMTDEMIEDTYFGKAKENQERIDTGV